MKSANRLWPYKPRAVSRLLAVSAATLSLAAAAYAYTAISRGTSGTVSTTTVSSTDDGPAGYWEIDSPSAADVGDSYTHNGWNVTWSGGVATITVPSGASVGSGYYEYYISAAHTTGGTTYDTEQNSRFDVN